MNAAKFLLLMGGDPYWSPARLGAGVAAWFDAKTPGSLSLSGSAVTAWASRGGSIVASQASGALQPTYSATARNGLPGLTFSFDRLDFNSNGSLPSGNNDGFLACVAYSADVGFNYAVNFGGGAGGPARSLAVYTGDYVSFIGGTGIGDVVASESWSGFDRIAVADIGSSLETLVVNGNASYSNSTTLATGTTLGHIGGTGGGQGWDGVIQEIVLGTRKLTTSERQKLEGYFAWRWSLTALLPIGHPYKNSRPV